MITVPLTADPSVTFTLEFNDSRYRITTKFNERSQVFTLDVAEADTDVDLITSMPVLLGANLLAAFCPRLGTMIAVDMAADVGFGTDTGPDDLGSRIQLVWLAPGETP